MKLLSCILAAQYFSERIYLDGLGNRQMATNFTTNRQLRVICVLYYARKSQFRTNEFVIDPPGSLLLL